MSDNRLIRHTGKSSYRGPTASNYSGGSYAPYANYAGYAMYAGYEDFPSPKDFR